MSYSILGTSCLPVTNALTSNHKFLPLNASVYSKRQTCMMLNSGMSNSNFPNYSRSFHHPESIKSFSTRNLSNLSNSVNSVNSVNSCNSCNSG